MVQVPGREIFQQRTEPGEPRHLAVALALVIVIIIVGSLFFQAFDGWFAGSTLVSQALMMFVGLAILSQLLVRRDDLQKRSGARAFSIAFRWLAVPGLTFVGVGLAHFARIEGERILPHEVALIPFLYLLLTGVVLWIRAIFVFGVDNLSMMYVYFPGESRLINSSIYSLLRHPVYSAALRVVFALCLWNGSAFALFAALMVPLSMMLWLRLVEERELMERFGDQYRSYRARVPAFFNLNPRTWMPFWNFLLTGK